MFLRSPQAKTGQEKIVGSGIHCGCGTIPLEYVPRAGATHQTKGIAKVVIDRDTQEIRGVSLVMANAGEVIHEAAMGMRFHTKLTDFIDVIHVHPTKAEGLKIAALSHFKDPARLSCCAESVRPDHEPHGWTGIRQTYPDETRYWDGAVTEFLGNADAWAPTFRERWLAHMQKAGTACREM